jgi:hypothetical protein
MTTDALERRLGEFELQHQALTALTIRTAAMKPLVEALLQMQQDLIGVMHGYIPKLKAFEQDETDQDALRRRAQRDEMKLRQQLAGIRLYCDAPVETRTGDER